MALTLERMGVDVEVHHHEVGGPGQAEIDLRFQPLLRMADAMQLYKYVVAQRRPPGGQGRDVHAEADLRGERLGHAHAQSLWKDGETLMYDPDGYGLLSDTARHYVGGLLAHAPALLAFCAPTTNSYKRLVPGYEAPVSLLYSQRNRSAAVRIPVYFASPKAKRVEFRSPDPARQPVPRVRRDADGGARRHPARGSSRRSRSTRTSTSCPPERAGADRRRCRRRWIACSTRSRPTTSSCSPATCSRPT